MSRTAALPAHGAPAQLSDRAQGKQRAPPLPPAQAQDGQYDLEDTNEPVRPGLLPIDDDADDDEDEEGDEERLGAHITTHRQDGRGSDGSLSVAPGSSKGKSKAIDADADEDPDDVLENALASVGLVPLQTYLTDWDSVLTARAREKVDKEMAAMQAASSSGTAGGKKKKKKKNKAASADGAAPGSNSDLAASATSAAASTAAKRNDQVRIEPDDADLAGPSNKKKRKAGKKKETFSIDENAPATKTLNELAQWLDFDTPVYSFRWVAADKAKRRPEGFIGRCELNGQLFVSRSVFPSKAAARDDVAQDIVESFLPDDAMDTDSD
ncbi:hypothetical protein OC844_002331 [Tilletia horrida]|nr:hypothetical protein OC844_002331 [Tilletia horrida]